MTSFDDDGRAEAERDRFRRDAEALGFVDHDLDDQLLFLESADDFIERMRRSDVDEAAEPAGRPIQTDGIRGRRIRRWASVGLVAAAAMAVAVGVARPGGSPAAAESPPVLDFEFASAVRIAYAPGEDPAATLTALSTAASARSADHGVGKIQYKRSDNWYLDLDDTGSSKIIPRVTETWLRPDGALITHEAVGKPLDSEGRGVRPEGEEHTVDETLKAGSVDARFARDLPTDPRLLVDGLLVHADCESRAVGAVRSMCLYREIVELNRTYVLSPELVGAIWDALKGESGFKSLGSVKDRAGRDAVGISIIDTAEPQVRHVLLGSLADGEIVGQEEILIKRKQNLNIKPPSVLSFSTILESRFVSSVPR
jgi:hypothetical protein